MNILYHIPPLFKPSAISLYSFILSKKKYGKEFNVTLNDLLNKSKADIKNHAYHLRNSFLSKKQGTKYCGREISINLKDNPTISKVDILEYYQDILTEKPYKFVKSSGSTGTPLKMPYNKKAYQMEYAFWWYHRSFAGVVRGDRIATIMGHKVVPVSQTSAPFWLYNKYENQLILSSQHLSEHNYSSYIDALNRFKPQLIHAYPSSLFLLARHIVNNNLSLRFVPNMIQLASETTLDFQREIIEKAFNCKVFIWYGNTEFAGHITEWPDGKLRVNPLHSFVRIVDENGNDVKEGEEGRIVATNFNNTTFPLINYDTKDMARFAGYDEDGWMLIDKIIGRIEDYIVTADGRFVGRLDHLFKNTHNIKNAQLEQYKPGEIVIRIVKDNGYNENNEALIRVEAMQRLGRGMKIKMEYVDTILKNKNGKFSFVIQHLKNAKLNSGV